MDPGRNYQCNAVVLLRQSLPPLLRGHCQNKATVLLARGQQRAIEIVSYYFHTHKETISRC
jgi:hypothetical protein